MAFVSDKAASEGRDVSFLTDDSVHLRGTYWEPGAPGNISVLLLHDFQSDRTAWKPFIPAFRSRGWGIFALDLRGHGESLRQDMRADALRPLERDLRASAHYPADVRAALAWVIRQAKTDPGRIGTIGVGLGADLSYAASAKGWGTASSVLIGLDEGRARELSGQGGFSPRSCYLMYADSDASASVSAPAFLNTTSFPKDAYVYANTTNTGIELYREKFPEIAARTIAWIERTC
ncbi:MAG: alpha/beta fold hydrolase [Candidatus Eremiobacteraeota bacterium]|nr:alpha/beta fold hydrolase [Candidatus Eremiobacteraeota bacterium]